MIKTPVTRHDVFTSSFVDKFGCFLDDKSLEDAAKRINMHDELVKALSMMTEVVGGNFCQNMAIIVTGKQA